jgi:hypothetical protein
MYHDTTAMLLSLLLFLLQPVASDKSVVAVVVVAARCLQILKCRSSSELTAVKVQRKMKACMNAAKEKMMI